MVSTTINQKIIIVIILAIMAALVLLLAPMRNKNVHILQQDYLGDPNGVIIER